MNRVETKLKPNGKKNKKATRNYQQLVAGTRKPMDADKIALQYSRYLQSILDPWNVAGAKIPDEITLPSFPLAASTKVTAVTVAGGGSGPTGRGLVYIVGSTASASGQKYQLLAVTAVADTYQTVAPGVTWAPGAQLVNISQSLRPVSCGIFLNVQAGLTNSQGRIIIGFLPPFDPLATIAAAGINVTATQLDNSAYSTSFPLSKVSGRAIFLPLDDIARSYIVSGGTGLGSAGLQARGTGVPTYGLLFALVDGAAAGISLEFNFAENFEAIPVSNQVNLSQPEVSSSDPIEMALASNYIAARPGIAAYQPVASSITGSPLTPGVSMTKHHSDGSTIMDKILSGLLTGAKFAAKAAPVALELMAML